MRIVHCNSGFVAFAGLVALALGFVAGDYHGKAMAPLDSELATAQELTGDTGVRWAGYSCGDDSATLVTRDMPDLTECREVRLLSESAAFPAPH